MTVYLETFQLDRLSDVDNLTKIFDNQEAASKIGAVARAVRMREDPEWFGCASVEALARVMSGDYAEGTTRVTDASKECMSLTVPLSKSIKPVWADRQLSGTRVNLDMMMQGQPRAWSRFDRTRVAQGSRIVTLFVPYGGQAGLSASKIAWAPVAAIVIADLLESAGYRVEINGYCQISQQNRGGGNTAAVKFSLKAADAVLDINGIARTVHPAFTRGIVYSFITECAARHGVFMESYLGYPNMDRPLIDEPGAIFLKPAYSLIQTIAEVKAVIEKFNRGE